MLPSPSRIHVPPINVRVPYRAIFYDNAMLRRYTTAIERKRERYRPLLHDDTINIQTTLTTSGRAKDAIAITVMSRRASEHNTGKHTTAVAKQNTYPYANYTYIPLTSIHCHTSHWVEPTTDGPTRHSKKQATVQRRTQNDTQAGPSHNRTRCRVHSPGIALRTPPPISVSRLFLARLTRARLSSLSSTPSAPPPS